MVEEMTGLGIGPGGMMGSRLTATAAAAAAAATTPLSAASSEEVISSGAGDLGRSSSSMRFAWHHRETEKTFLYVLLAVCLQKKPGTLPLAVAPS